jgi:excisionase family DNA binding protein
LEVLVKKYQLLDGNELDLSELEVSEQEFLKSLKKLGRSGVSYFEVYRVALGPGSLALQGKNRVDQELVVSPLYLAARDIATRIGIEQGLILAPEHQTARAEAPKNASMMSVTQASALLGMTRAAVYKAIERGDIKALRVGNVTVAERASVLAFSAGKAQTPRPSKASPVTRPRG